MTSGIIKLAVLAVGGQGGGVLADWITDVAERNGYLAQSTSVAGVAQRTGATIYYVEMCRDTGRRPVFALSPAQGDVDILIAAELMEAGRAIMRGFVTPERTTLIASSHRIAAVSEKIEPGDGRASSEKVRAAAEAASKRFIAFDMERIAAEAGSMISASLLGALAGSGALPFPRESYEQTIAASGRGIKASLDAFAGAFERARGDRACREPMPRRSRHAALAWRAGSQVVRTACCRAGGVCKHGSTPIPSRCATWRRAGLKKVVDYQDLAYGGEYLDRLDQAVALDDAAHGYALSIAAAKHLANAMCYDDMIRVADLKTRSTRDARVRREVGLKDDAILQVTEYFHPRIEEFCGTMPAGLGRYIEARPKLAGFLDRRINHGRRIRTDSFAGFAALGSSAACAAGAARLLRHEVEVAHLERWYRLLRSIMLRHDYGLAGSRSSIAAG